jgi:hypothetical protein
MSEYKYVLRNVTGRDINLGDLRYKVPAGKARDLYSRKSNLKYEDIIESIKNGSIGKYLRSGALIEAEKIVLEPSPQVTLANPSAVTFPQRIKSSVTIEVGDVTEEIRELTISEDDELLKQLEEEGAIFDGGEAPIVAKKDEKEEK